jgi:hypothetical protein
MLSGTQYGVASERGCAQPASCHAHRRSTFQREHRSQTGLLVARTYFIKCCTVALYQPSVVLSRAGLVALLTHHPRVATFGVRQPCCCASRTHDLARVRSLTLPVTGMHYPYLVSTMCVSAGMIAIGAVLGDRLGDSAPLQPCRHVLDGLPYTLIIRVSRRLECGSQAAAPAVLTIRRVAYRYPSRSRRCRTGSLRA